MAVNTFEEAIMMVKGKYRRFEAFRPEDERFVKVDSMTVALDEPVLGVYEPAGLFGRDARIVDCGDANWTEATYKIPALSCHGHFRKGCLQIVLRLTATEILRKMQEAERRRKIMENLAAKEAEAEKAAEREALENARKVHKKEHEERLSALGWMRFSEASAMIAKILPQIDMAVVRDDWDSEIRFKSVSEGHVGYPADDEYVRVMFVPGDEAYNRLGQIWSPDDTVFIVADKYPRLRPHDGICAELKESLVEGEEKSAWKDIPFHVALERIEALRRKFGEDENTLPLLVGRKDGSTDELRFPQEGETGYPSQDEHVSVTFARTGQWFAKGVSYRLDGPGAGLLKAGQFSTYPVCDLLLVTCSDWSWEHWHGQNHEDEQADHTDDYAKPVTSCAAETYCRAMRIYGQDSAFLEQNPGLMTILEAYGVNNCPEKVTDLRSELVRIAGVLEGRLGEDVVSDGVGQRIGCHLVELKQVEEGLDSLRDGVLAMIKDAEKMGERRFSDVVAYFRGIKGVKLRVARAKTDQPIEERFGDLVGTLRESEFYTFPEPNSIAWPKSDEPVSIVFPWVVVGLIDVRRLPVYVVCHGRREKLKTVAEAARETTKTEGHDGR